MYKWVGDLYELRENIICTLNEDGQLGNIQNTEDIQEKWKEIKPKIILKHRDEKYRDFFIKGVEELL